MQLWLCSDFVKILAYIQNMRELKNCEGKI